MILVVVEPEDHRGIFRHGHQQVTVVTHALLAEQLDLLEQLIVIVDFRVSGRENMVPEQRHFLFQGTLGRDEVIHVVDVAHGRHAAGQQRRRLIAK